jgi:hypothetical protein
MSTDSRTYTRGPGCVVKTRSSFPTKGVSRGIPQALEGTVVEKRGVESPDAPQR